MKNKKRTIKNTIYAVASILAVAMIMFGFKIAPAVSESLSQITELENQSEVFKKYDEDEEDVNELTLVNCDHPFDAKPTNLVCVYDNKTRSYFVKDKNVYIHKIAMQPLNDMMDDFYKETGLKTVNVISAYRSIEKQAELYEKIVLQNGADYASHYVQQPTLSEHHTGLAIDLGIFHSEDGSSETFKGEGEYEWFVKNCHKYGFVLRYAQGKEDITKISYEAWHFRYVGKKNAEYMLKHDLCLEEFLAK